ncbi:hypothetical protein SELMODRAFT_101093 [Selaginella moellendorffii]|uniref:DYW domain-containing protein n=1 Tax=Selaginella moellendorffii TaxID=88036 RepID=D8RTR3_SELML|nr:hypothetical protein SELMODRAFT_101093 [Selaginella moellendorffii]
MASSVRRAITKWLSPVLECGGVDAIREAVDLLEQSGAAGGTGDLEQLIRRCAGAKALEEGRRIHRWMDSGTLDRPRFLSNLLVDMYGKCGSLVEAKRVFDAMQHKNVFSWTMLMAGFVQSGRGVEAIQLFHRMCQEGELPDRVALLKFIDSCGAAKALSQGREIHSAAASCGMDSDLVTANAIINMYGKCGSIGEAFAVFTRMPEKNVISWSTMIAAFCQNELADEALLFFKLMQQEGMELDRITYVSVLDAYTSVGALELGKALHVRIVYAGLDTSIVVGNTLVNMYGKCGSPDDARDVFDSMVEKNVVSWNAMLAAYGQNGRSREALALFDSMDLEGVRPNDITFVTILYCCSHSGKFKDAVSHFVEMRQDFGITPREVHFGCLIDMLGRSGKLEEAEELIQAMPVPADAVLWTSLLCACVTHKDEDRAARAAEEAFQREPRCAAAYIMLSNLYAALKKWDEAAKVRKRMEQAGVRKQAGRSWIEIDKQVHEFVAGDSIHPDKSRIFKTLQRLMSEMRIKGYEPDRKVVIHSMEEEEKDEVLFYHSEKLAVAFGIASTPPRTPLCIVKNLRVCSDCHSAIKFISGVEGRRITVRDSNRFHHFDRGECSCGDYW